MTQSEESVNAENRLSILLGAGANLDIISELSEKYSKVPDISTDGLTATVLSYKHDAIHLRDKIPGFIVRCKEYLEKRGNLNPNFELIFQLILELYESRIKTNSMLDFFVPEEFSETDADLCNTTLFYILNSVFKELVSVSKYAVPKWSTDFLKRLSECFDYVDLFTMNYDTFFDTFLTNYNDGFTDDGTVKEDWIIPYKTFDEASAMTFEGSNVLNHLHGSILFNRARPRGEKSQTLMIKSEAPYDMIGLTQPYVTQSGGIADYSPIITGLDKPNMLIYEPFRTYYANFIKSLATNKRLLIIGYGFGDYHVNSCIHSFCRRDGVKLVYISPSSPPESFGVFDKLSEKLRINKGGTFLWFEGTFREAYESGLNMIDEYLVPL